MKTIIYLLAIVAVGFLGWAMQTQPGLSARHQAGARLACVQHVGYDPGCH